MLLQELIPTLQIAIGPVILVSGAGLLLLSMTNLFARVIDRTRQLTNELRAESHDHRESGTAQLHILLKRADLIRGAIALAAISVLLTALLIIFIFISAVLNLSDALLITGLFTACMVCLIVSLILFIADINLSLTALKLEVNSLGDKARCDERARQLGLDL